MTLLTGKEFWMRLGKNGKLNSHKNNEIVFTRNSNQNMRVVLWHLLTKTFANKLLEY